MSADRDTLVALLERVRAAAVADRGLSSEIHVALLGKTPWFETLHSTASTDAALILVERALPKQCMQLSRQGSRWFCTFTEDERLSWHPRHPPVGADTLPLAIVAALLSALIAQPQPTGMDQ